MLFLVLYKSLWFKFNKKYELFSVSINFYSLIHPTSDYKRYSYFDITQMKYRSFDYISYIFYLSSNCVISWFYPFLWNSSLLSKLNSSRISMLIWFFVWLVKDSKSGSILIFSSLTLSLEFCFERFPGIKSVSSIFILLP